MQIPAALREKFEGSHDLASFVYDAISRVTAHVKANTLIFFPEYTDHGITHFELTLQTAFDLASEASKNLLTDVDAACLTVSVALHDLGMHLTRDGFESLVCRESLWKGIDGIDTENWFDLWRSFLSEAARFDGRTLKSIFGPEYSPVRQPPPSPQQWGGSDYALVGEFLRRHHPRLAHEIAVYGLPGKNGQAISICQSLSDDQRSMADVCGLIARSHGMDLRPCIAYLSLHYKNSVDPRRIHAPYLAVLLRIADYFQIQASRAPHARTAVTIFQSSLSDREWRVHQSVMDINNTGSDPEAIYVIAQPRHVDEFLRLTDWLSGLQSELDKSWAILGEVYGLLQHAKLDRLGLRIRRVRSNIDDVDRFADSVAYIPKQIAFDVANADLLKLLVAPLYGDNPGIGLRELIQNSVDAVRELEHLLAKDRDFLKGDRDVLPADVLIEIDHEGEQGPWSIRISDRGIGMTPDVVQNYFLRAGASFRQSDAWKRSHQDASGHSEILRTGRFGVGALAAFLLGDEITVSTRHANSPPNAGVRFTTKIDDSQISVEKITRTAGTEITIRVPETRKNAVSRMLPRHHFNKTVNFRSDLGHYFLRYPSVERRVIDRSKPDTEPLVLPVEEFLPAQDEEDSDKWLRFSSDGYQSLFWSYASGVPSLSCNGIVISTESSDRSPHRDLLPCLSKPRLCVFDKDGLLPVNLQRTGLQAQNFSFSYDLLKSIVDEMICHAIVDFPGEYSAEWLSGKFEGFNQDRHNHLASSRWIVGAGGFCINDAAFIAESGAKEAVVAVGGPTTGTYFASHLVDALSEGAVMLSYAPGVLDGTNPRLKGVFSSAFDGLVVGDSIQLQRRELYFKKSLEQKIRAMGPGQNLLWKLQQFDTSQHRGDWLIPSSERGFLSKFGGKLADGSVIYSNEILFSVGSLDAIQSQKASRVAVDHWLDRLGNLFIPFDSNARRRLGEKIPQLSERLERRERRRSSTEQSRDDGAATIQVSLPAEANERLTILPN